MRAVKTYQYLIPILLFISLLVVCCDSGDDGDNSQHTIEDPTSILTEGDSLVTLVFDN